MVVVQAQGKSLKSLCVFLFSEVFLYMISTSFFGFYQERSDQWNTLQNHCHCLQSLNRPIILFCVKSKTHMLTFGSGCQVIKRFAGSNPSPTIYMFKYSSTTHLNKWLSKRRPKDPRQKRGSINFILITNYKRKATLISSFITFQTLRQTNVLYT